MSTIEVAGHSMSPALLPGDFLLLRRGPPPPGEAAFGRIVAFRNGQGLLVLKRVVGLPGESLRVGDAVHVNGRTLLEPYARGRCPPRQFRGVQRLEPGQLFLLGDRRDASTDSRDFGPVDASRVGGVAWFRYWPPGRIGRIRRPRRRFAAPDEPPNRHPPGIRENPEVPQARHGAP